MQTKEQARASAKKWRKEHPLQNVWLSIMRRTGHYNKPRPHEQKNYVERGIDICEEWKKFKTFEQWALANGWQPGLQIDRVDNDKGYSPDNCRFVTAKENSRNRRNNRLVVVRGETMPLATAVERFGVVSYQKAWVRLYRGWDVEKAIMTPD